MKIVISAFVRSCAGEKMNASPFAKSVSDHHLVEPSQQEFVPLIDGIVKRALNVLGEDGGNPYV